jgi:hypothetical protein
MSDPVNLSIAKLRKRTKLTTHRKWQIIVRPASCHRLELHDLLFHHNSAVLLPDSPLSDKLPSQNRKEWEDREILNKCQQSHPDSHERYRHGECGDDTSGLDEYYDTFAILAALFEFVRKYRNYCILLAGHTDTSGQESYNFALSKLRSQNVLFLLQGKKKEWVDVSNQKSKIEDYQHILRYFNNRFGWQCDPGPIDNSKGPKTEKAVIKFQEAYNTRFSMTISVDGKVGLQTWGAIFDIYQHRLSECLKNTNASPLSPELPFMQPHPYIACGENIPIDQAERDNFRSQANRRVEILLFKNEEIPELSCINSDTGFCMQGCNRGKCIVYNPHFYRQIPLVPETVDDMSAESEDNGYFRITDCETAPEEYVEVGYENDDCEIEYCSVDEEEKDDGWKFLDEFPEEDKPPIYKYCCEGRHEGVRES